MASARAMMGIEYPPAHDTCRAHFCRSHPRKQAQLCSTPFWTWASLTSNARLGTGELLPEERMNSVMASRGRPGTRGGQRLGTSSGQSEGGAPGPGIGLSTDVKVSQRPVTRQGLTGMTTKPLGPGRQIADKSYYLSLLRTKLNDISVEMKKNKDEYEKLQNDEVLQTQLERKYEVTIKDVRHLEGQLADFNLALDKIRTNTDVSEIKETHDELKYHNDQDRKKIDQIFIESKKVEKSTKELETEAEEINREAAEMMEALGPAVKQEYEELQAENQGYHRKIRKKEDYLDDLGQKIHNARQELQGEEYSRHQKGMELYKQQTELRKKVAELKEETEKNLSPAEIRTRSFEKIKAANAERKRVEESIKKQAENLDSMKDMIKKHQNTFDEAKRVEKKYKRYDALIQREPAITKYMNEFPEHKRAALKRTSQLEETNLLLLQHISKGAGWREDGGGKGPSKFDEIQKELKFKKKLMKGSKSTLSDLKVELARRQKEFTDIQKLQSKIPNELKRYQKKIDAMQSEMKTFKSPAELQEAAKIDKRRKLQDMQRKKRAVDYTKQLMELGRKELDEKEEKTEGEKTIKNLDTILKTLSYQNQKLFYLKDYITVKRAEGQYSHLADNVNKVAAEINALIKAS